MGFVEITVPMQRVQRYRIQRCKSISSAQAQATLLNSAVPPNFTTNQIIHHNNYGNCCDNSNYDQQLLVHNRTEALGVVSG